MEGYQTYMLLEMAIIWLFLIRAYTTTGMPQILLN